MSEHTSGGEVAAGGESQFPSSSISHQEICKMVQCVASAMEKNSHFQVLSRLPTEVRRRLRALRKLQIETNAVEIEMNQREFELEKEFQAKHQEIFRKRFEIITGAYEPIDEECDVPDPEILKRIDENAEIFAKLKEDDVNKESSDAAVDKVENAEISAIGVPHFWFNILYCNPTFDYLIQKEDEPILKHLIDIRVTYKLEPYCSFTLEFEFSPNQYFQNSILTKEYLLRMDSDDLMTYEGPSINRAIGCEILWKTEKLSRPSVFDFFNPPVLPEDVLDPSYEEIKSILENDFEIGDYVKDNIIPKAILYFTGERDDSDLEDSIGAEAESEESDVEDHFEGEKLK